MMNSDLTKEEFFEMRSAFLQMFVGRKKEEIFDICSVGNEKAFRFIENAVEHSNYVHRFIINGVVYIAFYTADNALCPERYTLVAPEFIETSITAIF
ncbi:hypothetical protein Kuja_0480 [Vibrio phage vB_VchM_Kuja]|uniref:Uncharacterized protein n=1 Tax=Vibrio phage vB_VchM_Kuja TaxID=2686437 RepID=A0A6B9J9B8_9CAUD|nr:hypothetical protein HWC83_gp048 [Vibrio phage vB_VchM_Kuja]QGZ16039.1 hypothetical protein Kuja_0480 [Vibrio phage vB_VchM_Kuja]